MYSIASWSPSQSEPLIVSYMCHNQLSSDMLPSAAPMPPCAATVCERVGNTFDSTATESPASASCSDARMPDPPAPTTSASNLRTASATMRPPQGETHARRRVDGRSWARAPENLDRPAEVGDQHGDRDELQREAQSSRLHVVHVDVAKLDPCVEKERHHEDERRRQEEAVAEER